MTEIYDVVCMTEIYDVVICMIERYDVVCMTGRTDSDSVCLFSRPPVTAARPIIRNNGLLEKSKIEPPVLFGLLQISITIN